MCVLCVYYVYINTHTHVSLYLRKICYVYIINIFICKLNYMNINICMQIFSKYVLYVYVFIYTQHTHIHIYYVKTFILKAINHVTALD